MQKNKKIYGMPNKNEQKMLTIYNLLEKTKKTIKNAMFCFSDFKNVIEFLCLFLEIHLTCT